MPNDTYKGKLIREILMAVNANAERTKGWPNQARKADADMFFSLAFRSEKELKQICLKANIPLP